MISIMISIQPQWWKRIVSGEKTIEIRKTRPRMLKVPFRCFVYETRGDERFGNEEYTFVKKGSGRGAVVGEFVCNAVFPMSFYASDASFFDEQPPFGIPGTCLTDRDIAEYLGNGKRGYGWNIDNLKIYANPKPITAFMRPCPNEGPCTICKYAELDPVNEILDCENRLFRAPQSWCYVDVPD